MRRSSEVIILLWVDFYRPILAEVAGSVTPYQYANNNPVLLNDPSGAIVAVRPGDWWWYTGKGPDNYWLEEKGSYSEAFRPGYRDFGEIAGGNNSGGDITGWLYDMYLAVPDGTKLYNYNGSFIGYGNDNTRYMTSGYFYGIGEPVYRNGVAGEFSAIMYEFTPPTGTWNGGTGNALALAGTLALPVPWDTPWWLAEAAPPIAAGIATGMVLDVAETAATNRTSVTYIKRHPSGSVYDGRASGYGDPLTVMRNRDSNHHINALGYGAANLDVFARGFRGTPGMGFGTAAAAYAAIRGREQQMIDMYGGVGSPLVGNTIRGVSVYNPLGRFYHEAANVAFGNVAPYTGF